MAEKPTIECAENGPYLVKNLVQLQNSKGESLETKPVIALCRCGKSENKPFCDGTHSRIGFTGAAENDGSNDKRDTYQGQKITIHDNRSICAHAGFCTDNLASVFRLKQEPWIYPDAADGQAIVEVIRKCPSGALSYTIEDVEYTDSDHNSAVTIAPNGPYVITGDIDLQDMPRGEGAVQGQCTLCRCGGSKNKPFCDGSHWSNDFKDEMN
ncbi:MAG: CDGSH iron-sulfur domain-containing protein [bacterium]|nr:CDGSH iron-sulfur domain-containing protein [bacterium]